MGNVYDVKLSNGETRTVEVSEHHENHTAERFKAILFDVLRGTASGAASGLTSAAITVFVFKGRRK
jgi:hypothetical protein